MIDLVRDTHPHSVYSSQQARQLDTIAIEHQGIKGYELMCRAGDAAFRLITANYPSAKRILILVGGGNNAGDGYVLARLLHNEEYQCTVIPMISPDKLKEDALLAFQEYVSQGGELGTYSNPLPACDLLVDAIFGIGLDRPLEEPMLSVINQINQHPAPTLSIDIPSGLNSDSGIPMDTAVYADSTLTFIGVKSGLLTGQAADYAGKVFINNLQLDDQVFNKVRPLGSTLSDLMLKEFLPPRKASAHKNSFGHVLIIGGNVGFPNAASMAAIAAARSGAGLISVITHPKSVDAIASSCTSLMVRGLYEPSDIGNLIHQSDVIVLGPGLGKNTWAKRFFAWAIDLNKPMVVDADALNLLSHNPGQKENWVLTPHPGEAARLLGCEKNEIENNRIAAVKSLEKKYQGVIVLKGAGTLIQNHEYLSFCTYGNASLATGGTGDVLSGVIGGLIAQHLTPMEAANCGTTIHGKAGENISLHGTRGCLASDLFPEIHRLVNPCQR